MIGCACYEPSVYGKDWLDAPNDCRITRLSVAAALAAVPSVLQYVTRHGGRYTRRAMGS
jgi:hypothetical protein